MASIKPIDNRSIHHIQSGQVIVDLCSVVKELVENSLDAGANIIDVRFKNQGLDLIEVQDNGSGISPENYSSVALKHHTSKLSTFSDLASVQTFGFRGEALASLTALSTLTIMTCLTNDVPKGSKLTFESSGVLKNATITAAQRGTTVSVETLFHNLPVRRRELDRNIKREWHKTISFLNQYACIQTNLKFSVSHQPAKGKKVLLFSTKGNASTRDNVINIFGAKTMAALVSLDLRLEIRPSAAGYGLRADTAYSGSASKQVRVVGHVSRPAHGEGRQTPDRQMFFVNGRPCALPQIAKVFNEVYRSYNASQSPFILADIRLDTNLYDVNVSPDKRSILLHGQGHLLDTLRASLSNLFDGHDYTVPVGRTSRVARSSSVERGMPESLMALKPHYKGEATLQDASRSDDDHSDSESLNTDSVTGSRHKAREQSSTVASRTRHKFHGNHSLLAMFSRHNGNVVPQQQTSSEFESVDTTVSAIVPPSGNQSNSIDQDESDHDDEPDFDDHDVDDAKCPRQSSSSLSESAANSMAVRDFNKRLEDAALGEKPRTRASSTIFPTESGSSSPIKLPRQAFSRPPIIKSFPRGKVSLDSLRMVIGDESLEHSIASSRKKLRSRPPSPDLGDEYSDDPLDRELHLQESLFVEEELVGMDVDPQSSRQSSPSMNDQDSAESTDGDESQDKRVKKGPLPPKQPGSVLNEPVSTAADGHQHASSGLWEERFTQMKFTRREDLNDADAEAKLSLTLTKSDFAQMRVVGQFNLGFIVVVRPARRRTGDDDDANIEHDELFLIDQHAADEKYNFERLQKNTILEAQRLAHPKRLELTALEEEILLDNTSAIEANGFKVEIDTTGRWPVGSRCQLTALPLSGDTTFGLQDLAELISLLGEQASSGGSSHIPRPSKVRSMFAMRACRSSIMIGRALTMDQMYAVVRHMGELDKPWNCPHGRPTMRHLLRLPQ